MFFVIQVVVGSNLNVRSGSSNANGREVDDTTFNSMPTTVFPGEEFNLPKIEKDRNSDTNSAELSDELDSDAERSLLYDRHYNRDSINLRRRDSHRYQPLKKNEKPIASRDDL